MPKRKTDYHCYAPGCHSGHFGKSGSAICEEQTSPLTESSVVCERHFEPRQILRDYVHIISSTEVRLPRGKP